MTYLLFNDQMVSERKQLNPKVISQGFIPSFKETTQDTNIQRFNGRFNPGFNIRHATI